MFNAMLMHFHFQEKYSMVAHYSLRVTCGKRVVRQDKDTPLEAGLFDGWRNIYSWSLDSGLYSNPEDVTVTMELKFPIPTLTKLQPLDNDSFSDFSIKVGYELRDLFSSLKTHLHFRSERR